MAALIVTTDDDIVRLSPEMRKSIEEFVGFPLPVGMWEIDVRKHVYKDGNFKWEHVATQYVDFGGKGEDGCDYSNPDWDSKYHIPAKDGEVITEMTWDDEYRSGYKYVGRRVTTEDEWVDINGYEQY